MPTTTPQSPRTREPAAGTNRKFPQARRAVRGPQGVKVVWSVTIRRPAGELYAFWRNLENVMKVVKHPVSIQRTSDLESHWSVSAPPGDRCVEWDAVIFNDEPDRLIAWRSREGAEIDNAGTVRFEPAPGDEGTEVTVQLEYNPPGGKLASKLAKLTGEEAGQQVREALRRFKALMEAGEIPTTEGQPVGAPRGGRRGRKSA